MGTSRQTMDFLLDQLDRALPITTRKMFGEYCVYWDGKPVAFVCDDQLFVKPTEAAPTALRGRARKRGTLAGLSTAQAAQDGVHVGGQTCLHLCLCPSPSLRLYPLPHRLVNSCLAA